MARGVGEGGCIRWGGGGIGSVCYCPFRHGKG